MPNTTGNTQYSLPLLIGYGDASQQLIVTLNITFDDPDFEFPFSYRIIATVIHLLIFVFGVTGNVVLIVVAQTTRSLQSPTYCYLVGIFPLFAPFAPFAPFPLLLFLPFLPFLPFFPIFPFFPFFPFFPISPRKWIVDFSYFLFVGVARAG